jgi:8-oxo-dGTP pyrophosphatase MutT (NUDIX family)
VERFKTQEVLSIRAQARGCEVEGGEAFELNNQDGWESRCPFSVHLDFQSSRSLNTGISSFSLSRSPARLILVPNADVYRQAASLLVLRSFSESDPVMFEMLLLHKPRRNDSWQLPQGGVEEGESVEQAALRELFEEAGINDAKVIGKSEECYQYDFPPSFRRFRRDHVCGQCIHYLYALVSNDTRVQVDGKEIDGFVWIDPADLTKYIKRDAYVTLVQKLLQEAMPLALPLVS